MIWLVGIPYLVLMFLLCFCEESEFDFGFSNLFITLEIGLMSISWTQKVKLFYAVLLANNSHCSGVM